LHAIDHAGVKRRHKQVSHVHHTSISLQAHDQVAT
jgi:hypothetical protein